MGRGRGYPPSFLDLRGEFSVTLVPFDLLLLCRSVASSCASWEAVCWDESERAVSASSVEDVSSVDTRSGAALIGDMIFFALKLVERAEREHKILTE